ncbi:hypothetical protein SELMODRAFT_128769 [Selaginella moellendorffii]|uniref:Pentacotripeptide-repeat region of PRORP domain-containing protein n=1 Tax=Selaginella moellendorffii TaxID=88036 RepID=D8SZQ6_SELML|nr:hypothetical protein SELMODRAFT_128769 [Selaginella moellendorffii]
MYGKCGSVENARKVFDSISQRDAISWNILIAAYAQNGHVYEAKMLFEETPQKDVVSWNTVITAFLQEGKTSIANGYFDRMPQRNAVSGNLMVQAFAQLGQIDRTKEVFDSMPEANSCIATWTALVQSYARIGHLERSKAVFGRMPKHNRVAANSMLQGLIRSGWIVQAKAIFDEMPERDVASWTSIAFAFAQAGDLDQSARLFHRSPQLDVVSCNSIISAFGASGELEFARWVFDSMPDAARNTISWTAMLHAHAQRCDREGVERCFDAMPTHDLVSWAAFLGCYVHLGELDRARDALARMPNWSGLAWNSVLSAAAENNLVAMAESLFREIPDKEDPLACAMMIGLYAQNGRIDRAWEAFIGVPERSRTVVAWTGMVGGYARTGHPERALELFREMELSGVIPDRVAMITVMDACSHAGELDRGVCYFVSTQADYGIESSCDHWCCAVDLLGRAGEIERAEELVDAMPFVPGGAVWGSLLNGCRIQRDLGRAIRAAEQLVLDLEPGNSGPILALASIYCGLDWNVGAQTKERALSKQEKHKRTQNN